MEYGEERAWRERTGDRMYEKETKIPTERFQNYATMRLNLISPDMPQEQSEWLYSNMSNIPSYETYNPDATVLGFAVLDWNTKKISEKRLKMVLNRHTTAPLTPADVLRYARKWQDSWIPELF